MNDYTVRIPIKIPSLNDYIRACRTSPQVGAKMKRDTEAAISLFLLHVPLYRRPVWIDFIWTEKDLRRDADNIAFGKKFILDALVAKGKLQNDDRRHVVGFSDAFQIGEKTAVTITIKEVTP